MEASTRKQAFIELKSTLKRTFSASLSKDLVQIVIPVTEFPKNYQLIVNMYYKSEATKFISLEVSFMIIKFLLEYNYRAEAISFITYAVYISNLPIREEAKVYIIILKRLYDMILQSYYCFRLGVIWRSVICTRGVKCGICRPFTNGFQPVAFSNSSKQPLLPSRAASNKMPILSAC
jgi:hypothetical protein